MRSAMRCFTRVHQETVRPSRVAEATSCPTRKAQSKTLRLRASRSSARAMALAWIFSSTRGTAARIVGCTSASTSPNRGMSLRYQPCPPTRSPRYSV